MSQLVCNEDNNLERARYWRALLQKAQGLFQARASRATFLELLNCNIPDTDCWCIGGDFNMFEDIEDRVGESQDHG